MRNVDVAQTEHEGQPVFLLSDPEGYVDKQLLLAPLGLYIAGQFDGETSIDAIRERFRAESGGQDIDPTQIESVAAFLDEQGFLLSGRFQEIRKQVDEEFARSAIRPAFLAGRSYPATPEELQSFLNDQYTGAGGPGTPPSGAPGDAPATRCLIVPHIDIPRGGHTYAHGYARLYEGPPPDTVFVFGVAHNSPPVPFVLTRKHFETPFGTVETDRALVDQLAHTCSWDPFEYEQVHRTEHSIEFQVIQLAHIFRQDVRIVPILCGGFPVQMPEGVGPGQAEIDAFLQACAAYFHDADRRCLAIASADLAHVGKRFGDDFDIDAEIIAAIAQRDSEDLAHALRHDARGWQDAVHQDENARRICGVNCIYSALRATEGVSGTGDMLHYSSAPDPAGGIVSFAAVAYPEVAA